jgi:hypothetical protein
MAMTVGEAKVLVEADLSKLNSGLNKGESTVKGWTSKIGGFFTGAFVVGVGIALAKMIGLIANGMKSAAGLIKNLFVAAIKATDDEQGEIKRLANEMGSLELAAKTIEDIEKKSIKWKVATGDLIDGYTKLRRFFDEKFIQKNLEDITSASKQLQIPVGELAQMISGLGEGMLSARRLLAMGVSKKDLAGAGVMFSIDDPDKIISDSNTVLTAIMSIWNSKYTNGPGKDIQTMGGFIIQLKNLWDIFLEDVGKAGVYDLVISKLSGIVTWIQNNSEQIKKWATDISKFFSDTFAGLSAVLEKVLGVNISPKVMPNKDKTAAEIGKMMGFDQARIDDAVLMINNGFTKAMKDSPEGKKIAADVWAMFAKSKETTGGKDILTPFWEKMVSGIESGDFKTRVSSALTSAITNIGNNEALMSAAGNVGGKIAWAIIKGIITIFGDWEIKFAKEHPILGFGLGGGLGEFAAEGLNNYASKLDGSNQRQRMTQK